MHQVTEWLRRALRDAVRSLRRTPAFTVTVVLILGLGIGMTSAMFTVFQNVVLRRLPVQNQERLVMLAGIAKGAAAREFPLLTQQYRRFRNQAQTLSGVTAYAHWGAYDFPVSIGERHLTLKGSAVTANFFDVLGVTPVLGRTFRQDDERDWGVQDRNAGDFQAVISYDTWQRTFNGDRDVIGHRFMLDAVKWQPVIIGVAPPGLAFPRGVDYWLASTYGGGMDVIGRLAPGMTAEAARLEYFNFIDSDPDYSDLGPHSLGAQVHPFTEAVLGDIRGALLILTAAVGLLLLLACVNIGNLLLLRATQRSRDLSIRRALGASSLAIVSGLMAEALVLAVLGGALGLGLARWLLTVVIRFAPEGLPRLDVLRQAGTPLAIAASVTLLTVFLFGLAPALGTLRMDLASPLKADTRGGTEGRRLRAIRRVLVGSQMALALIVLAGAGLLFRSFVHLTEIDFGYPIDHLSIIQVAAPYDRYVTECGGRPPSSDSIATVRLGNCVDRRVADLHDRLERRVPVVPEVASFSTAQITPFVGPSVFMTKIVKDDQSESQASQNPWFAFESVGPNFFHTFQIPLLVGRAFNDTDRESAPRVAIITQAIAQTLWPGMDPIGKRFRHAGAPVPDSLITVVGVVPDVHYREHRVSTPTIYLPYPQANPQGTFAVRTHGSLPAALPAIRKAVEEVEPQATVIKSATMDDLVAPQLAQPRLNTMLLSIFAASAMLLAAVGLYGIMAQMVTQQTRELGVRLALGATPGGLRQMVLKQALKVAAVGALCGLVGALAGARVLTSMLFEVSPTDPLTLIAVSALLLTVAGLAAYIPARRATRIDPAQALRAD